MYLRRINHRQADGKKRNYWVLLESYRTERGPRQRIVSYLGEEDEAGRLGIKQAAEGKGYYQERLFNDTEEPEWVEVDIRKVRTEKTLRFGDIFLAEELIKRLQLDKLFEELLDYPDVVGVGRKAEIPYNILAEMLVISRICEPSGELYIAEQFIKESAICEVLGIDEEKIYDNRLYRGLDKLIEQKEKIQQRMKQSAAE